MRTMCEMTITTTATMTEKATTKHNNQPQSGRNHEWEYRATLAGKQ